MNSYPQTSIESQPLTEQIKEIHKNASLREIRFSVIFRIVFSILIYILYLILGIYIVEVQILNLYLTFILSIYFCILINIYIYKNIMGNFIGYLMPSIDTLFIFTCLWISSDFHNKFMYLHSINIILMYIIIQTSLQGNYKQTLYSGVLVSIFSYMYFIIFDPMYYTRKLNATNIILTQFDILNYSLYYLFGGIILAIKNYIRDSSIKNVRDLIIKKIVTKAHLKLLSSNGEHIENNWSIKSEIIHSEMLGADFISIKQSPDGVVNVSIGDVTSHGLDVSPIAYACLSIFHGVQTDNPQIILTDMHKLVNKLGKKLSSGFLAMVFRLHPNGRIDYNGTLATPLEINKQGKIISLSTEGFIIGKNEYNAPNVYKNKRIVMKKDDTLSIKTDGYYNLSVKDDISILEIKYLGKNSFIKESYTN